MLFRSVFAKYIGEKYPETFDPSIDRSLIYCGTKLLTDKIPVMHDGRQLLIDAGKLVLSPTRTYAPVIKKIVEEYRNDIHGMIHCSGGGQTKILHFINNLHIVKDQLFPVPPLFELIQHESAASWKEMYTVFNMGHRMELYTNETTASKIIAIAQRFKIEAKVIGRAENSPSKKLTIISDKGKFEWN